jgi:hypothetical protein
MGKSNDIKLLGSALEIVIIACLGNGSVECYFLFFFFFLASRSEPTAIKLSHSFSDTRGNYHGRALG